MMEDYTQWASYPEPMYSAAVDTQGPEMSEYQRRLADAQRYATAKEQELAAERARVAEMDRRFGALGSVERRAQRPGGQDFVGPGAARGAGMMREYPRGRMYAEQPEAEPGRGPGREDMSAVRQRLDELERRYAKVMKPGPDRSDMDALDAEEQAYAKAMSPSEARRELQQIRNAKLDAYSDLGREDTRTRGAMQGSAEMPGAGDSAGLDELMRRATEMERRYNSAVKPYTYGEK